jgi:hypothetical protein
MLSIIAALVNVTGVALLLDAVDTKSPTNIFPLVPPLFPNNSMETWADELFEMLPATSLAQA